jgi:hypothetical protein
MARDQIGPQPVAGRQGDFNPAVRRAMVVAVSPRIRRSTLAVLAGALGILVLLIAAWAIDTAVHSGGVMRNVALDGNGVGGLAESDLSMVVSELVAASDERAVVVETPTGNLDTTAAGIGLQVDRQATESAALERGRNEAFPLRPFAWFGALFVDQDDDIVKANRVDPKEPAILVADDQLVATPGEPGEGLDLDDLAAQLEHEAHSSSDPGKTITVALSPQPVPPHFGDGDAQAVAREANALTGQPITVHVAGATTSISPATLRTWMRAVPAPDGDHMVLDIDPAPVATDISSEVGEVGAVGVPPVQLSWAVQPDGSVTYTPGTNGTACCAPDSAQRVVDALRTGHRDVTLDLTVATPDHDAVWAEQMNIHQAIASFTTPHACCESRVQNIHRISDLVRGAVIAPGETFSVNGYVGQRTSAKGFAEAGVIYNGRYTSDVGGGVSQFATTLFNAAFFGGLDFAEYQAHTIYISRYPYGREATLSYPKPDLKITNTTPFGILLWPTYTGTSVTVTLYSTPWVTGDQTGQTREPSGACTRVRTQRTRTWLIDGRQEVDTVSALYQPGEGVLC